MFDDVFWTEMRKSSGKRSRNYYLDNTEFNRFHDH